MRWNQMWLNYALAEKKGQCPGKEYFSHVFCPEMTAVTGSAVKELQRFAKEVFGMDCRVNEHEEKEGRGIVLRLSDDNNFGQDGFCIFGEGDTICIGAHTENGILYGVFELIRRIMRGENPENIYTKQTPEFKYRMLNHWDNIDGSIERGYSGRSFFFENDNILFTERLEDYARLVSSIGINQVVINNVNVRGKAAFFITDEYLGDIKKYADLFAKYAIKLFLCVDFAAPITVGGLETADPLDETVTKWWKECVAHIYSVIPEFGGFLLKADSEGRPGPFYYGRNHADGANMLADAIAPWNGKIIWRCFVYNCKQDWRDGSVDRAKAAYESFMPIDGQFRENVILQIKNGPMDFQVREPVSPLFGGLLHTNQMLEVQIAQEYTGQQIDVCYLVPMWKEILSFHTCCCEGRDTVADIVSGRTFGNTECGIAAVANTGNDANWTGNDLAAANLYGYGRLAWDSTLSADAIAREWCECTFGCEKKITDSVTEILRMSWPAYEKYTTPYGIGWMVTPHTHYGPSIEGYEYDAWGTYHKANHVAIGIERGPEGTGYTSQYNEPNAAMYREIETCPENLLLFFHRIRYDYKMKNGKTLLQNIYDLHFEGAEDVEKMICLWEALKGELPEEVYARVRERFDRQYTNSKNWRDIVNTYFYRMTMTEDEKKRRIYD